MKTFPLCSEKNYLWVLKVNVSNHWNFNLMCLKWDEEGKKKRPKLGILGVSFVVCQNSATVRDFPRPPHTRHTLFDYRGVNWSTVREGFMAESVCHAGNHLELNGWRVYAYLNIWFSMLNDSPLYSIDSGFCGAFLKRCQTGALYVN